MPLQNLILTLGVAGLWLSVSTSAFAAYYGTDAYVRGSGSCASTVYPYQCSPGDLPYSYDSSNPASNTGVSSTSSSGPAVNSNSGSQASGTGNTTGGFVNGTSSSTAGINSLHASAAVNVANIIPDTIRGWSSARAIWYDTLTITSNTYPYGTAVVLTGEVHMSGLLSINNSAAYRDYTRGQLNVALNGNYGHSGGANCLVTYDPLYGWASDGYLVTGNPLPCAKTFAMSTFVGDSIVVSGILDAYAEAYSGLGSTDPYADPRLYNQWLAGGDAYADFTHTGSISLQAPTGFSFTADSGTSYAPVPLPAAVWLFGSGLLGLVGVARRRVHTSRHRGHERDPQAASSGLRLRRSGKQDEGH